MRIRWTTTTRLAAAVALIALLAALSWGATCSLMPAYADSIGLSCP